MALSKGDDRSFGTLVGISFDDPFRAQEFLVAVTRLASRGNLVLNDAVTIIKDEGGKTLVHETIDPTPGRSAINGAMWAGLFGLILGGPVGWAAGAAIGAGGGALAANAVDLGISDEWVAWFREAVEPGTATVALLLAELDRNALVAEAKRFTGAEVVYADLDPDTMSRIQQALAGSEHGGPTGGAGPAADHGHGSAPDAATTDGGTAQVSPEV
jgi:uncharacterized membrane protein